MLVNSWKLEHIKYIDKFAISKWLVTLLKFIFFLLDWIFDFGFGYTITNGSRTERKKAKKYEHSAQLVDILFRGNYSIIFNHQPSNFLYCHNKYVNPRFVLENDNCTLMGLTPTHAFFCVTKDPTKSVLDTIKEPFMFVSQYLNAEQLLLMPLESFHRLAAELGDPDDRNVTVMDMTGRCGSTLMCQIAAKLPNFRVLSEPWVILHAHGLHVTKKYTRKQLRQVICSSFRILCKPENDSKIKHIFVKSSEVTMQQQPMLQKLFPKFKFIFITRHCRPWLLSLTKMASTLPTFFMKTPLQLNFTFDHHGCPYDEEEWCQRKEAYMAIVPQSKFLLPLALTYASNMYCYSKNKNNYSQVILYEDFMQDPVNQTRMFLDTLGISHEYLPRAMEALKQDSQHGILGERGSEKFALSDDLIKDVDAILEECNLPLRMDMSYDELRNFLYGLQ